MVKTGVSLLISLLIGVLLVHSTELNPDILQTKVDECMNVLYDQRPANNFPKERIDLIGSFSELEFDVLLSGRYNISVSNCFDSSHSPYYLKDMCIFECPFLYKQKGKLSGITSLSEYHQLTKTMQKVASITPRHSHRIAVVTSSFGSHQGEPFYDVQDFTRTVDRFDLKGDLSHLPNIVANYRYIVVDLQQNTVCAHLLIQLIYFAKRTILLPTKNHDLAMHSEVSPFVLAIGDNKITNKTYSYLFRHATDTQLQSAAAYRFAMNFLTLKRRCSNLRSFQMQLLNSSISTTTPLPNTSSQFDLSTTSVSPLSLLKPGRGHRYSHNNRNRHRHESYLRSVDGNDATKSNNLEIRDSISQGKLFVVLSHFNGSLNINQTAWMTGFKHIIYDRSGVNIPQNNATSLLNIVPVDTMRDRGFDASIFLRFIISNYDNLPDTIVFSHSSNDNDIYSIDDLHHDVFSLTEEIKELRSENSGFAFLGDHCMRLFENLPLQYHFPLHRYFAQWLEFPVNRWYADSGSFVVTKAAILRRNLESYHTLLRLVDYQRDNDPIESTLMRITWPSVFRSSCIVGNFDDCMLRKLDHCGLSPNDETKYTFDISIS